MEVTDNSIKVKDAMSEKLPAILESIGLQIEGESKDELENDPRRIDTGNLRNSISHAVNENDNSVLIGTAVEYAIFVRWSMREREFMRSMVTEGKIRGAMRTRTANGTSRTA